MVVTLSSTTIALILAEKEIYAAFAEPEEAEHTEEPAEAEEPAPEDVEEPEMTEMDSKLLCKIFYDSFVNRPGVYRMENYQRASVGERSGVNFTWYVNGEPHELTGQGNGPLSAVVHSLKNSGLMPFFKLEDFSERSLGTDADARAMAFVGLRTSPESSQLVYGAGEHANIDRAAIAALVCALNRAVELGVHPKP